MESKLSGVRQHLEENFHLKLEIDEAHVQHLVSMGKVGHGGRGLINVIEREVVNPMSLFIFNHLHQIGDRQLRLYIDQGEDGSSRFSLKE